MLSHLGEGPEVAFLQDMIHEDHEDHDHTPGLLGRRSVSHLGQLDVQDDPNDHPRDDDSF